MIWSISISALFARKLTSDQDFSFMILKTCLKASKKGNVYMDENPVCDDGWSSLQNTESVSQMVVCPSYSEVEFLNFHIQSL